MAERTGRTTGEEDRDPPDASATEPTAPVTDPALSAAGDAPGGAAQERGAVLALLHRAHRTLGRALNRTGARLRLGRAAHPLRQQGATSTGAEAEREAGHLGSRVPTRSTVPLGPSQADPASTQEDEAGGPVSASEPVSAPTGSAGAAGSAHATHPPVGSTAPATEATATTVTTRSSALASLPGWLVRAGLGAWLLLGVIVMIALAVLAMAKVVPVFVGVFIALVLTSILQPLVGLFARVMPRYPATFLALLTALALLVGLVAYVVNSVTSQWASLAAQLSSGVDTIVDFVEHGPLPLHLTQQQLADQFQEWLDQGQDYLQNNAPSLASEVLSNASGVVDFFAVMALAVFTTIFLLASGTRMWRWFLNELPAHVREPVHRAAGAGWYTFAGYARGTVIVALTDALMAGIFLQLVGIPLAAPLAVLVFIGAFIPLVGAPVAMVIAMVVALASEGFLTMVVVGLGVAGIGQIEGHILQPLIMGRQVSLHPVVVIVGVAVGTYSAGLLGAIIAVPVISVAWSVYSELHVKDAPVVGELPAYAPARDE